MNYALVDISTAPRIVDMADTLTEAIAMRQGNFRYRYTHIFRLITKNGIQQLSGDEAKRERMTREDIILHDNLLRKQEAEELKRKQREQREAENAANN